MLAIVLIIVCYFATEVNNFVGVLPRNGQKEYPQDRITKKRAYIEDSIEVPLQMFSVREAAVP